MKRVVVRQTLWTGFAMFLLLSASFFAVALTPDPNRQLAGMGAALAAIEEGGDPEASLEAMAAYDQARNRDRPLHDRYVDWIVGYATFNWGWSYAYEEPVADVIGDAVPVTLAYVVPALLVSWGVSVLGGLYAALRRGGTLDRLGRAATYVGVGLPAVILIVLLQVEARSGTISYPHYHRAAGPFTADNLVALTVPIAIVASSMVVMQWRVVRAESLALANRDFAKALRADGADDARLGRHVLKNATAPLLAVFNAEVLTAVFLTMYVVEYFFGLPGLGTVTLRAFEARDIGLILATVLLPAFVGLLGNFLTDVVAAVVDPRVSL